MPSNLQDKLGARVQEFKSHEHTTALRWFAELIYKFSLFPHLYDGPWGAGNMKKREPKQADCSQ